MAFRWRSGALGIIGAGLALPLVAADKLVRRGVPVAAEPERSQSYWMASIPELPRAPQLDQDITADVVVVGGGFTGLATAYYAKRLDPALRVVLLEAHRLGSGASSRNSGGATPRFRGHDASPAAARGYALLRSFCDSEGLDVDLEESVPVLTLHRYSTTCKNAGLCGDELARQIGSPFYAAAEISVSNRLHPGKLIAGLVHANLRAGVEIYESSPVVQIDRTNSPVLHTRHGRVTAQNVVLATNAYTPGLGIARDVMAVIHHRVIVTRQLTANEWATSGLEQWPYRLEAGGYYTHTVRATPDRRFFYRHVLGHRPFEETSWELDRHAAGVGHGELVRRYPWLDGVPIEYEWHGVTGRTRDWWPVSGQIDDHLYVAAGYNGSGVMATHYFGHLIAHCVVGKHHEDLALLKPPAQHPKLPGELLRHLTIRGWFQYHRLRDGWR